MTVRVTACQFTKVKRSRISCFTVCNAKENFEICQNPPNPGFLKMFIKDILYCLSQYMNSGIICSTETNNNAKIRAVKEETRRVFQSHCLRERQTGKGRRVHFETIIKSRLCSVKRRSRSSLCQTVSFSFIVRYKSNLTYRDMNRKCPISGYFGQKI